MTTPSLLASGGAKTVTLEIFGSLRDFLGPQNHARLSQQQGAGMQALVHEFSGAPAMKDALESLGMPHTEVGQVVRDGRPASLRDPLMAGESIQVFPYACGEQALPWPVRGPRFVLDVHLGKLARTLRLLGIDTLYRNDYEDAEIIALSLAEERTVLTRDLGILKHGKLERGYFVRATEARKQTQEVAERFALRPWVRPFQRCIQCNGTIVEVAVEDVVTQLPPRVAGFVQRVYRCRDCGKLYWRGSHYPHIMEKIETTLAELMQSPWDLAAFRIVSGGQTGVDRAALDAAMEQGLAVGGWCPSGREAEDGPISASYPLQELAGGYVERTRRNALDSDATLVVFFAELEGGTELTVRFLHELGKPFLRIDGAAMAPADAAALLRLFLESVGGARAVRFQPGKVWTLNVAGPRASKQPHAYGYVRALFKAWFAGLGGS